MKTFYEILSESLRGENIGPVRRGNKLPPSVEAAGAFLRSKFRKKESDRRDDSNRRDY